MNVKSCVVTFLKREIIEDDTFEVKDEYPLLTSGLLDSIGLMRMVRHLEKRLKVNISFEDITLENFSSIKSIEEYLQNK